MRLKKILKVDYLSGKPRSVHKVSSIILKKKVLATLFQQAEKRIFIIYPSAFGISLKSRGENLETPTQRVVEFFRLKFT
jgi:hypothetical protein